MESAIDGGDRGEREIGGSVWQKETREDSKEIGKSEIEESRRRKKDTAGSGRRR
jgi:hypothetical protein